MSINECLNLDFPFTGPPIEYFIVKAVEDRIIVPVKAQHGGNHQERSANIALLENTMVFGVSLSQDAQETFQQRLLPYKHSIDILYEWGLLQEHEWLNLIRGLDNCRGLRDLIYKEEWNKKKRAVLSANILYRLPIDVLKTMLSDMSPGHFFIDADIHASLWSAVLDAYVQNHLGHKYWTKQRHYYSTLRQVWQVTDELAKIQRTTFQERLEEQSNKDLDATWKRVWAKWREYKKRGYSSEQACRLLEYEKPLTVLMLNKYDISKNSFVIIK